MKYAIVIERDPETGAIAATSPDIEELFVVGDPDDSDERMIERVRVALEEYFDYLRSIGSPIPQPRHTVATVAA